ncbi:YraN family protein [Phytoactinopolyspora endophytica]|uniref:YraN family protein n=1 Tax=Phytoactinopolyspora endophytica TaxID=1642495 RepID=UPI00101C3597|nr:YraN family protein [Phytoactinopolyspora endophytica]
MRVKDGVGAYGEDVAVEHLEENGLVVIARNWRCAAGEIDIVALDGDIVVVCEVKTRSGFGYGSGLEAVTREKGARLRRLALAWRNANGFEGATVRVDVVAVHRGQQGSPLIEHVKGAF